ncbi:MAG: hypothetical protein ACRYFS_23525 [Janthinobacterium lividum]
MTLSMTKGLALCGLCALLAGVGGSASAQDGFHDGPMHHGPMHHARHAIMRQKMAYARAVEHGNYAAAEQAHMRARMIRHHVRAHRHEMHDMHMDHGY